MKERVVEFTPDEASEIAQVARDLARLGEPAVWEIVRIKVKLMGVAIRGAINGVVVNDVYYSPQQIRHEVDVMEEITKQARLILQFEGRDSLSQLDRDAMAAGWGSVYDPESKIYKIINKDNRF